MVLCTFRQFRVSLTTSRLLGITDSDYQALVDSPLGVVDVMPVAIFGDIFRELRNTEPF